MGDRILFARPAIGQEEIDEVVDCLRSGWISTGPRARTFEENFADHIGEGVEALAVSSATAGLHLALEALGVGPGDKVLTTTYTFTATAEVVVYLGAEPVFVDVDPETLNIDPVQCESLLSSDPSIKAMIPVHFAGLACDMAKLQDIARRHDVVIVEDAAHALPATFANRRIGTIGDITVFSFYATKTLATGEGGMVTTKREDLAKRMRQMRLHGIDRDAFDRYTSDKPAWYYQVVAPGFKYNMSDLSAALGLHQLNKVQLFRHRREAIASRYFEAFADLPLQLPAGPPSGDEHAWHLYVVRLQQEHGSVNRDEFINRMTKAGIGTSVHFIPLHVHPYWRDNYRLSTDQFPVAQTAYEAAVSLPIYPSLTDPELERICTTVRECCWP